MKGIPDDAKWRKSTRSTNVGQCVEVTDQGDVWGVRDSKNTNGAVLTIPTPVWAAFIAAVGAKGSTTG